MFPLEQECGRQLEQLTQAVLVLTTATPTAIGIRHDDPQPKDSANAARGGGWRATVAVHT